ncbi:MAG: hypothetical protein U0992_09295 [Planctomycetaceae bacterium]
MLCLIGLVALLVAAVIWHGGPKGRLIAEIRAAGGDYREYHAGSIVERTLAPVLRVPVRVERTVVLQGPDFDDHWLATHDDFVAIEFNQLSIEGTRINRDAIHRLLQKHEINCLGINGGPFSDAEAKLLTNNISLHFLVLRGTEMTDEGFSHIPLFSVFLLNVAESPVTSAALEKRLTGLPLKYLGLDGRQFTPELAKFLGTMPTLQSIDLVGPEITDEHLELLKLIPGLRGLTLDETSVSPEALQALRTAHPEWGLYVDRKQVQPGHR